MGLWNDQVVPRLGERALRNEYLGELRARACAPLHGRVLELGFGSGLNVRHHPAAVESVTAVEPSDVAWRLGETRRSASRVAVARGDLDAQQLTEPDASYDSVLSTFTLCTVPDPGAALGEALRVLRPGGVLCLLEHGLAPDERVERWQHRLEPLQRRVAGGCHLTRDVPALVRESGFEIAELGADYLDGPAVSRPWTYAYLVAATRP